MYTEDSNVSEKKYIPKKLGFFGMYFEEKEKEKIFIVSKHYIQLPASLFATLKLFYIHVMNNISSSTLEVSVMLCFNKNTKTWKLLVPKQEVTPVSVHADLDDMVDLITGEHFNIIPDGFKHVGSTHSHNQMEAFFSSTDDSSELIFPGMHFVIGKLKSIEDYSIIASIVCNDNKRRIVAANKLIDVSVVEEPKAFHENALKQVKEKPLFSFKKDELKDFSDTDISALLKQVREYILDEVRNNPDSLVVIEDFLTSTTFGVEEAIEEYNYMDARLRELTYEPPMFSDCDYGRVEDFSEYYDPFFVKY